MLKQILALLGDALHEFFRDDMDVMSREARRILSNKEDAGKYRDALNELRNGRAKVDVTFSNGYSLTLVN